MRVKMLLNGWKYHVVFSFQEAVEVIEFYSNYPRP